MYIYIMYIYIMYIPHPTAYAYVMLFVMEMLRKISRISREDSLADSLVIPSIFAKAKGISSKTASEKPHQQAAALAISTSRNLGRSTHPLPFAFAQI